MSVRKSRPGVFQSLAEPSILMPTGVTSRMSGAAARAGLTVAIATAQSAAIVRAARERRGRCIWPPVDHRRL